MQRQSQLAVLRPETCDDRRPTAIARAKLRVEGISKRYGTAEVLQPTHLEIAAGELVTILGPSGSGKTTLLHIICGLVEPTAGRLLIEENVAFPLQMCRLPARKLREKVGTALDLVGRTEFATRFP